MAGTRVPGEGETPTEMEQGMNFGQLLERKPNLLWKVGSPAGWEHPVKIPSLQTSGSIKQPSRFGMGPTGIGEGAGLSQGLGETAPLVCGALRGERGAGGDPS